MVDLVDLVDLVDPVDSVVYSVGYGDSRYTLAKHMEDLPLFKLLIQSTGETLFTFTSYKEEFIQFESSFNNLRFHTNVSNYQKFQPITFEYLLEGYLPEWVSVKESPFIEFNNLKPGDYEFKVKAKKNEMIIVIFFIYLVIKFKK